MEKINKAMVRAIHDTDPQKVKQLLAQGVDPNLRTKDGHPLIEEASLLVQEESVEIFRALLEAGADPNLSKAGSGCALGYVTFHPNPLGRQLMQLLLQHGASPDLVDGEERTVFLVASGPPHSDGGDRMRLLAAHGANIHALDGEERNAVHIASQGLDPGKLQAAIDLGVDVDHKDKAGRTAWDYCRDVDHGLAQQFLEILEAAGAGPSGENPLGDELVEILRRLRVPLETRKVLPNLRAAAREGNVEVVKIFLDDGEDPNDSKYDGWGYPLEDAQKAGHDEVVKVLREHGAQENPSRGRSGGRSGGAGGGWIRRFLWKAMTSVFGWALKRAMKKAAKETMGEDSLGDLFDKFSQLEPNATMLEGEERKKAIARALELIEQGALGADPAHFRVGDTYIMPFAAEHGLLEVAQLLLQKGVPATCPPQMDDSYGPLSQAASEGYRDIVRLLLGAGAHPDVPDQKDRRQLPLHEAARRGDPEIAGLLLDAGADPMQRTEGGTTALQECEGPRGNAVKALLRAHMKGQSTGVRFEAWEGEEAIEGVKAYEELQDGEDSHLVLVRAPIESVAQAWSQLNNGPGEIENDVFANVPNAEAQGNFLLQMREDPWTVILIRYRQNTRIGAGQLSKALNSAALNWVVYEGMTYIDFFENGKKTFQLNEERELDKIDFDDEDAEEDSEDAYGALCEEIQERIATFFRQQGVRVPPVDEDSDGNELWLVMHGVSREDVGQVSFVILEFPEAI